MPHLPLQPSKIQSATNAIHNLPPASNDYATELLSIMMEINALKTMITTAVAQFKTAIAALNLLSLIRLQEITLKIRFCFSVLFFPSATHLHVNYNQWHLLHLLTAPPFLQTMSEYLKFYLPKITQNDLSLMWPWDATLPLPQCLKNVYLPYKQMQTDPTIQMFTQNLYQQNSTQPTNTKQHYHIYYINGINPIKL